MKLYYPVNCGLRYVVDEIDSPSSVCEIVKNGSRYYLMCRTGSNILLYESKDEAWDEGMRLINLKIDEYMEARKVMLEKRNQ